MDEIAGNQQPLLAGRYQIRQVIGQGGMATVYHAFDLNLGRAVAVKVLRPALGSAQEVFEQAIQEARNTAALKGPHTVSVYDCCVVGQECLIVMELIDGINLRDAMRRFGRMSPVGVARVGIETCLSLAEAHGRGIIHRDIKPSNIMFLRKGDIKVTDFGIAQSLYGRFVRQAQAVGTVRYMSPEQTRGLPPTTTDDIYALGVSMYELCCGHGPFGGISNEELVKGGPRPVPLAPSHWNPLVDETLEAIIMRCIRDKAQDRFQTAGQLHRALEDWVTSRGSERPKGTDAPFPLAPRYWALAFPKMGSAPANYITVERQMIIGRGEDADVRLPSHTLLERHARVTPTGALLRVDDLGTSGGTILNGEPVSTWAYCVPGDVLQLGSTRLTVGCSHAR